MDPDIWVKNAFYLLEKYNFLSENNIEYIQDNCPLMFYRKSIIKKAKNYNGTLDKDFKPISFIEIINICKAYIHISKLYDDYADDIQKDLPFRKSIIKLAQIEIANEMSIN